AEGVDNLQVRQRASPLADRTFAKSWELDPPFEMNYEHFRRPSDAQAGRLMSGACDIFGIATVVAMHAFGGQFEHAIGQACEKMPIMRDEEHRALILRQRLDQHVLCRHVKM